MSTTKLPPERRAELMAQCITLINHAHGLRPTTHPEGDVRECFVQIACSMLLEMFDGDVEEAKAQLDDCSKSFCAYVVFPDEL